MAHLGVGLYGVNGHQVQGQVAANPATRLVAVAGMPDDAAPPAFADGEARCYATLAELLDDPAVELVSLCSSRRADQAAHAVACLQAGKHVYAEKPCALTEAELDAILQAAQKTSARFHEMAGTAFRAPYSALRAAVAAGDVGTVVQVFAQKCYPYHERRPQDEAVDGGLLMQVGVHAARMVEHVGGVKMAELGALETSLGNPAEGGLRMACSLSGRLENGGLATIIANYFNQAAFPSWGYEVLRIFGTDGFVEATDAGRSTRLVHRDGRCGPLPDGTDEDYFDLVVAELTAGRRPPLSLEDEVHPTRMLIRAKAHAVPSRGKG